MAKVFNSEFVEGVSCDHSWKGIGNNSNINQTCTQCGATCVRAADGKIVEYERMLWDDKQAYEAINEWLASEGRNNRRV